MKKQKNVNELIGWLVLALLLLEPLLFIRVYDLFRLPKIAVIWVLGSLILTAIAGRNFIDKRWRFSLDWTSAGPFVFVFLLALSLPFSINPMISLIGNRGSYLGLLTYAAALGLFLGGRVLAAEKKDYQHNLLRLLALVAAVSGAVGWLQFFGLNFPISFAEFGGERVGGLVGNPNNFGALLVFILPFLLGYYYLASAGEKIPAGVALLFCFSGILLSKSSIALLVALFTCGLFLLRARLAGKKLYGGRLIGLFLSVVLIAAVALTLLPGEQASLASRKTLWQAGAIMAAEKPLTGMGLDTLSYVTSRYATPDFKLEEKQLADVHNLPLNLAAGAGLPSAVAWLAFVLFLIVASLKREDFSYFRFGAEAAVVGYLLILQTTPESPALLGYFWVFAGILAAESHAGGNSRAAADRTPARTSALCTNKMLIALPVLPAVALVAVSVFWSARLLQAEYYFGQAQRSTSASVSVALTKKATGAVPFYEYYYTQLAGKGVAAAEEIDPKFWRIVFMAANEAIKINPLESSNYAALGFYDLSRKDYAGARRNLEQAIALDPHNLNALFGLAKTFRLMGRPEKSLLWEKRLSRYVGKDDAKLTELAKYKAKPQRKVVR